MDLISLERYFIHNTIKLDLKELVNPNFYRKAWSLATDSGVKEPLFFYLFLFIFYYYYYLLEVVVCGNPAQNAIHLFLKKLL